MTCPPVKILYWLIVQGPILLKNNYFTKYITRYHNMQWSAQKRPLGLNLLGVLPHFRIPQIFCATDELCHGPGVPQLSSEDAYARSWGCPGLSCSQARVVRQVLPVRSWTASPGMLPCCWAPGSIQLWQLRHINCEILLFCLVLQRIKNNYSWQNKLCFPMHYPDLTWDCVCVCVCVCLCVCLLIFLNYSD